MKYKITSTYNWYYAGDIRLMVKMYSINGVAFAFDEISQLLKDDPYVITEMTNNRIFTQEELYKTSSYLIEEEAHPLLFDMNENIENPQELPNT